MTLKEKKLNAIFILKFTIVMDVRKLELLANRCLTMSERKANGFQDKQHQDIPAISISRSDDCASRLIRRTTNPINTIMERLAQRAGGPMGQTS
jgi:hypothetical protein